MWRHVALSCPLDLSYSGNKSESHDQIGSDRLIALEEGTYLSRSSMRDVIWTFGFPRHTDRLHGLLRGADVSISTTQRVLVCHGC